MHRATVISIVTLFRNMALITTKELKVVAFETETKDID